MDLVDEFAQVRAAIRALEDRAATLREELLKPGVRLRSNRNEVVVRKSIRRSFQKELLPPELLNAARFWKDCEQVTVLVRPLQDMPLELTEPFSP
jgi:hypothetical protein